MDPLAISFDSECSNAQAAAAIRGLIGMTVEITLYDAATQAELLTEPYPWTTRRAVITAQGGTADAVVILNGSEDDDDLVETGVIKNIVVLPRDT